MNSTNKAVLLTVLAAVTISALLPRALRRVGRDKRHPRATRALPGARLPTSERRIAVLGLRVALVSMVLSAVATVSGAGQLWVSVLTLKAGGGSPTVNASPSSQPASQAVSPPDIWFPIMIDGETYYLRGSYWKSPGGYSKSTVWLGS
jgi:hypothetical protein